MESTIQIILIICIVSLTAVFVAAGVWVILILREIRIAAGKVSKIGDDVEETSQFVKQKIKDGFSMMALMATLSTIWAKRDKISDLIPEMEDSLESKEEKQPDEEKKEGDEEKEEKPKKKKRKFFFQKK